MQIKEASIETGLSTHMIRYYEKLGLIKPDRLNNKYRDYSPTDIFLIILIKQYNNLGVDLKTIKNIFKTNNLSLGLESIENYIHELQQETLWIKTKIENSKEMAGIIIDLQSNVKYKEIKNYSIYFYPNPHTKEYSDLISKTHSIKYCFRVKNNMFHSEFPNDIGIISSHPIPQTSLNYDSYKKVNILRAYRNIAQGKLLDKNDLKTIIDEIEKNNFRIIGDCFIYQIFNIPKEKMDTICLDFIIE